MGLVRARLPAVRLPEIDVLDVRRDAGLRAGRPTSSALTASTRGVWLVGWQDEVVDPVGFAPYFLDLAGQESRAGQRFWHLRVRHWRSMPGPSPGAAPQPQHPQGANFAPPDRTVGLGRPRIRRDHAVLAGAQPIVEDYQISLVFEGGKSGRRWVAGTVVRPDILYPTMRWQPPGSSAATLRSARSSFGRYPVPLAQSTERRGVRRRVCRTRHNGYSGQPGGQARAAGPPGHAAEPFGDGHCVC